jgi:hypothetical protein
MQHDQPEYVTFKSDITVDAQDIADIPSITVGVTSGLWSQITTPDAVGQTISVQTPVPNS